MTTPKQDLTGWQPIETAPPNIWIEAGMFSDASPTGWWVCTAIRQAPEDEADHWTDGDLIVHYNGSNLVTAFKGPFTHWRPLLPPTPQKPEPSGERRTEVCWHCGQPARLHDETLECPSPTPGDKDASISKMEIVEPSGSVEGLQQDVHDWQQAYLDRGIVPGQEAVSSSVKTANLIRRLAEALKRMDAALGASERFRLEEGVQAALLESENQRLSLEVGRIRQRNANLSAGNAKKVKELEALREYVALKEGWADPSLYCFETAFGKAIAALTGIANLPLPHEQSAVAIARNCLAGGAE